MFIPHFRLFRLILPALLLSISAHAEVYKWVDDSGQTHYSQTPPDDAQAETLSIPAPPPINAERAQQRVDELIEQQQQQELAQEKTEQQALEAAERQAAIEENCMRLRENLTVYKNNPGRRMMDEDGNVTRLREEDRQQNIQDLEDQIQRYCQ